MGTLLVLNDRQVQDLVSMDDAIAVTERAFAAIADGSVLMPPKLYLNFPAFEGDLRIMPAAVGSAFAGVKVVNSHGRNPEKGLPTVVGTYLLCSQETGMPLALMNATALTAIRTGAASAVATKHMARRDASSVGLVGAGVQARYQLQAIAAVRSIDEVLVWAPERDRERRDAFVAAISESFKCSAVDAIDDAASADIVVTSTPSRKPIVMAAMVSQGAHINAVGADGYGKQELDPQLLLNGRVVVDEWEQASHGGELNVPIAEGIISKADVAGSLDQVVTGAVEGRTSEEEITIFDSTGLAIEDVAVATLAYERALAEKVTTTIEL